jgi:hypothetical protein
LIARAAKSADETDDFMDAVTSSLTANILVRTGKWILSIRSKISKV